jgi:hypothetical protein
MMKFDIENVVQTGDGDTLSIAVGCGECCHGNFIISMFGNSPRTYNKGTFTRAELKKLGTIIARLTE